VSAVWSGSLVHKRPGREQANAAEARRKGDVARYRAGRREQNRWASIRFFDRMAANHAALAEGFRSRAEALINDEADRGGKPAPG
jgi:hypothetical protein